MKESGYVEGENLAIEHRWAENEPAMPSAWGANRKSRTADACA
jgi:hypothetical protein